MATARARRLYLEQCSTFWFPVSGCHWPASIRCCGRGEAGLLEEILRKPSMQTQYGYSFQLDITHQYSY